MSKKNLVIIIGALAIIFIAGALLFNWRGKNRLPAEETKFTINVGYKKHLVYTPFFVAMEKGYFIERNLKVNPVAFESTNQMLGAVIAGQLDTVIAGSNLPTIFGLEAKSSGSIKIFNEVKIGDDSMLTCVLNGKDNSLKSIEDIKGKRIGIWPGSFAPLWLEATLNTVGLSQDDAQVKVIDPKLQLNTLESGQIDVLFALEPICSFAVNKDIGKIIYKEPMKNVARVFAASVISADFIEKNPEIADKIVGVVDKATDFLRANPEESLDIMSKWTGYDKEMIKGIKVLDYTKSNETDINAIQSLADKLLVEGVLEHKINVNDLMYK